MSFATSRPKQSTDGKHSSHGSAHFVPRFASAIRGLPRSIDLPLEDWEEVLRPLLTIRDEMLKLTKPPNSNFPWKRGVCDGCSTFYIIDDFILHLLFLRGNFCAKSPSSQYQDSLWYSGDMATELIDHGNSLFMLSMMSFTHRW